MVGEVEYFAIYCFNEILFSLFRNTEKRKERSRDAARCRRSREAEIFSDMSEMLPLSKDDVNMLDKASVIRIAITYLRIRNVIKWRKNK